MDIKRTDGASVTSWRFTHGEEQFLLSYAHPSGWMVDASDEALAYNPVPGVEVQKARYLGGQYRTITRLSIPGHNEKRRSAPLEALEAVVRDYVELITTS